MSLRYLLGAAALSVSGHCLAQAANSAATEQDDQQLEVVVVTAQKRSQDLNDVGLTIQAISGEELRAAGVTTTSDLAQVVPGFNFSRSNANTPIFTLRGIGFQTPNLSSTSPVGIYFDEVAYAYPYMANGPSFDLERVEVLKGPQGTLYGRNTTGGLVNFITAKPTRNFEAAVAAEIGNYATYNVEGFVSGPVSDAVSVRLAGRSENSNEGWQESRTRGEELGEKDRSAARLLLSWEPVSELTVDLGASWWKDQSDTVAPQASGLDLARPATAIPGLAATVHTDWDSQEADWDAREPGKPPFRTDSDFYAVTGRVGYEMPSGVSLVSLTAYNRLRRRDFNDLDGTPFELLAYGSNGRIGSFTQEFRVSGETDRLNWLLGALYARDNVTDDQFGFYGQNSTVRLLRLFGGSIPQTNYTAEQIANGFRNFVNVTDQTTRSTSVLGNAEWQFSEGWTLIGGLRYTNDRILFTGCSQDYEGNTIPIWNTAVAALTGSNTNVAVNECLTYSADFTDNVLARKRLNEDNVAWRVGLNYEPTVDTLLFASVARGFKSGAFPVLPANVEIQFEPAVQEQVTAYETGVKASLLDRTVQANLSVFFYDYRDKQIFGDVQDPVFTTLSRIVNVPQSEVYGAEAELTWHVTRGLRLQSGFAYVHSEVTKFIGINRFGDEQDFAGQRFPNTPRWQVNGQATLDQPIGARLVFSTVLNASYQSEAEGAIGAGEEFRIDPYTIVNASLALRTADGRIAVNLFARNLLDEEYWSTTDTVIDTIFRVPGMPRSYGASLAYRFD